MVVKKVINMNLFLLIILMTMASNCSKDKIWKDDELSIQKTPYTGSQLRIDGYYYLQKDTFFYDIYLYYRNGIILAAGGISSSVIEMDNYINREFINNKNYQKYKSNWGIFKIEGNIVQFERWYPSEPPLKVYVREGQILNDTTFVITESYRMKNGKKKESTIRNEIYHFKEFSPKPDSTNTFIE